MKHVLNIKIFLETERPILMDTINHDKEYIASLSGGEINKKYPFKFVLGLISKHIRDISSHSAIKITKVEVN